MNTWAKSVNLIRRAYAPPIIEQPLSVRSVAHGVFEAGSYEDRHIRPFTKIIWLVRGTAEMRFSQRRLQAKKNDIAVFLPSTKHTALAMSPELEIRWITFDSPAAAEMLKRFGIPKAGVYPIGPCPETIFEKIKNSLTEPTQQNEALAGSYAYQLLTHISAYSEQTSKTDPVVENIKRSIDERWNDPTLSVDLLADSIGLNRTTLSKRFNKALGAPPKTYLINLRMQRAMTLLKQSTVPVSEIAGACGYPDVNYFIRLFRTKTGSSPLVFRNHGV